MTSRHAMLLAVLFAFGLLAACSGTGPVVADPRPTGSAAAQCAALRAALPATLMGNARQPGTAANTAAWGDPAITLRCGVRTPGPLDPASAAYDPALAHHDAEAINGVCWLAAQAGTAGFQFTTIVQQAYVEVNVPGAYAGQQSPLGSLAPSILRTDPADPARSRFNCL